MGLARDLDSQIGVIAAAAGSTGLSFQVFMDFANVAVVILNIGLALGGIILLWFRIRKLVREARDVDKASSHD